MRRVFPNLRFCALDPIRIAMDTATSNYAGRNAPTTTRRDVISEINPDVRGGGGFEFVPGRASAVYSA